MSNAGLVLEGGAMRGIYTAGVLECFLEDKINFQYVIGVSAGACMVASYLSDQSGRNKRVKTRQTTEIRKTKGTNLSIFTKIRSFYYILQIN